MIYKLKFEERTEFVQAKSQLHLLQTYESEYEGFQDINEIEEITEEESKKIMLLNTEFNEDNASDMPKEISLYDMVCGDDFVIVGSTNMK